LVLSIITLGHVILDLIAEPPCPATTHQLGRFKGSSTLSSGKVQHAFIPRLSEPIEYRLHHLLRLRNQILIPDLGAPIG
jgi:hypothetical protein